MLEEADVRGVSLGYDDDVSMGSFLSYNGDNAGALMLDSLGAQLFSNLHQVRVEGIPEHFYTVYMAYHKKHVHSRAVADFIDFVKAYPGNDLIGQGLRRPSRGAGPDRPRRTCGGRLGLWSLDCPVRPILQAV